MYETQVTWKDVLVRELLCASVISVLVHSTVLLLPEFVIFDMRSTSWNTLITFTVMGYLWDLCIALRIRKLSCFSLAAAAQFRHFICTAIAYVYTCAIMASAAPVYFTLNIQTHIYVGTRTELLKQLDTALQAHELASANTPFVATLTTTNSQSATLMPSQNGTDSICVNATTLDIIDLTKSSDDSATNADATTTTNKTSAHAVTLTPVPLISFAEPQTFKVEDYIRYLHANAAQCVPELMRLSKTKPDALPLIYGYRGERLYGTYTNSLVVTRAIWHNPNNAEQTITMTPTPLWTVISNIVRERHGYRNLAAAPVNRWRLSERTPVIYAALVYDPLMQCERVYIGQTKSIKARWTTTASSTANSHMSSCYKWLKFMTMAPTLDMQLQYHKDRIGNPLYANFVMLAHWFFMIQRTATWMSPTGEAASAIPEARGFHPLALFVLEEVAQPATGSLDALLRARETHWIQTLCNVLAAPLILNVALPKHV